MDVMAAHDIHVTFYVEPYTPNHAENYARDVLYLIRNYGFFLAYINSFNEWHEGHQFEPSRDRGDLTDAERALRLHNGDNGSYRLDTLRDLIRDVVDR